MTLIYILQDLGAHIISWHINPDAEVGILNFWPF